MENKNVNDILNDGNEVDPNEAKMRDVPDMNPIVKKRLERDAEQELNNNSEESLITNDNDYVTRNEIRNLVDDINVQFKGITSMLNELMSRDKTYKSALMNLQGSVSSLNSKIATLERNP